MVNSRLCQALIGGAMLLAGGATWAESLVMISPGTLVLGDKQRAGVVLASAPGDKLASLDVSDAFFGQRADGVLQAGDPATDARSASRFLRVGPRRFATSPGESVAVRVAARPPADLAPGEYRLHLTIANRGGESPTPQEAGEGQGADGIAVSIPIRVARAARVLYRHQVVPEGGRLEALERGVREGNAVLGFDVVRLGQTSLLGRYQLFARDARGGETALGKAQGASIYAELERRRFEAGVPLAEVPAGAALCVRLTVDDPGAPQLGAVEACAP